MNEYEKHAQDFLQKTGTTLYIVEAVPQTYPLYAKGEKCGIQYSVTLKNARHEYTFPFWDSIHNAERMNCARTADLNGPQWREAAKGAGLEKIKGLHAWVNEKSNRAKVAEAYRPTSYDILACLSPIYGDTWEDFCASYGYDEDSRTAEAVYRTCIEQDRQLRKLYSTEELEELSKIS